MLQKHSNLQCFLPSRAPKNLHLSCRDSADANDGPPKVLLQACIHFQLRGLEATFSSVAMFDHFPYVFDVF